MRTTIDIDDDLLRDLKKCAQKAQLPLKKVINSTIRKGIQNPAKSTPIRPYKCTAYSMGKPLDSSVNFDKALLLAEIMEDSEIARKLELRK